MPEVRSTLIRCTLGRLALLRSHPTFPWSKRVPASGAGHGFL